MIYWVYRQNFHQKAVNTKISLILNPTADARKTQLHYRFTIRNPWLYIGWPENSKKCQNFHTLLKGKGSRNRFSSNQKRTKVDYSNKYILIWMKLSVLLMKFVNKFKNQPTFFSKGPYHKSIEIEKLYKLDSQQLMVSAKISKFYWKYFFLKSPDEQKTHFSLDWKKTQRL